MASVFTHIIQGDLPGHFVWKDDLAVAFMTIQPVREGHLLVIPREEVDHWDHLPEATATHLMAISQKITKGLKQAYPCTRVGLVIAGLEVPHTHIHLMPIDRLSDLNFSSAKDASADSLATAAQNIRTELSKLGFSEANFD